MRRGATDKRGLRNLVCKSIAKRMQSRLEAGDRAKRRESKVVSDQQDVINDPRPFEFGMKIANRFHRSQKQFRAAALGPMRPAVGSIDPV